MSGRIELDAAEIKAALADLNDELVAAGVGASAYIVGGAAMALAHDSRRSTADVDAALTPLAPVLRAAAAVARRRGLPDGWLSSAAAAYLPNREPIEHATPGLHLMVADARVLLAMKLLANRERDFEDMQVLVRALGLRTVEDVVAVAHEVYPDGWALRWDEDELALTAGEVLAALGDTPSRG